MLVVPVPKPDWVHLFKVCLGKPDRRSWGGCAEADWGFFLVYLYSHAAYMDHGGIHISPFSCLQPAR